MTRTTFFPEVKQLRFHIPGGYVELCGSQVIISDGTAKVIFDGTWWIYEALKPAREAQASDGVVLRINEPQ